MPELLLLHGLDGIGQLTDADRLRMMQDPRVPRAIKDALMVGQRERTQAPARASRFQEAERRRLMEEAARRERIAVESRRVLDTPARRLQVEEGRLRAQSYTRQARLRQARASFNDRARFKLPNMPATVQRMVAQLAQAGVYSDIESIPGFDAYAAGQMSFEQLAGRIASDFTLWKAKAEADREQSRLLRRSAEEAAWQARQTVAPGHQEPPGIRALLPKAPPPPVIPRISPPPPVEPVTPPVMDRPRRVTARIPEPPRIPIQKSARRAMQDSEEYRRATAYVDLMFPKERGRTKKLQLREAVYGRIIRGELKVDSRGIEIRPPGPPPAPKLPTTTRPTARVLEDWQLPAHLRRVKHRPLISR
jgi:hypothetical protein